MRHQPDNTDQRLEQYLTQFKTPSEKEMNLAAERIQRQLNNASEQSEVRLIEPQAAVRSKGMRRLGFVVASVAAVFGLFYVSAKLVRNVDAHAIVEIADGGLLRAGQRINPGEVIRADDAGAVLALADESRVEMRSQSQLVLENAEDGVRIRLEEGGVIVNAAKQGARRLYVQTKDMMVSVGGTVFLVQTEQEGSRVAVIEGAVRVHSGQNQATLLPGEQVASSPSLQPRPVQEELAWSRSAPSHLALMQQSAPPPMAVVAKQLEFEVVSIKPEPPTRPEDIGPGGGGIDCLATDGRFGSPQSQGAALGRCFGRHVSLMWLIDAAYDLGAQAPGRIVQTGYSKPNPGPGMQFEPWISDLWDHGYEIEAKAENPATTTREQLRQMLRAMLADRFKLRVTQEKREVEALALSVESGGPKLREVATESGIRLQRQIVGGVRQIRVSGSGRMSAFITGHQPFFITDNTGLTGIYAFDLSYEVPVPPPQEGGARGGGGGAGPSPWLIALQNALREQLGLRLANEKVQANFVVIDHVEKPTEN